MNAAGGWGIAVAAHIAAGAVGIVSGFVALYSTKGATLHRRAGTVFVWTMLAMAVTALVISAVRGVEPATNIPAALLTAYLVVTGVTTVRPRATGGRWVGFVAMWVALGVGMVSLGFGFEAVARGGERDGMPAFPFFLFGGVGLLGALLDLRVIRGGGVRGVARIARHLWRLCFALFIAALSFFLGQADEIPKAIRIPVLLAVPVVMVAVTMLYWLWRVRIRGTMPFAAGRGLAPGAGS